MITVVDAGIATWSTEAAMIEETVPYTVRLVKYPDGEVSLQGAYAWRCGQNHGTTWRKLRTINVDNNGAEIK